MIRAVCPVCDAADPVQIEHREDVPVFLNRLANTTDLARASPRGVLDFVGCDHCGFVWNRLFDPDLVTYDPEYENDQTHSAAFRAHVEQMAARVLDTAGNAPIDVVEVGCGQGTFLRALAAKAGPRLRQAIGFDPSFRGENILSDSRVRVIREYFGERTVSLLDAPPSLVITRHTIEHVAEPALFLRAIRQAIGATRARLFVETPDVSWIIRRGEIEDLFYEHCSLFDPRSMVLALHAAGFVPTNVGCVFEDQYLWAEATANDPNGTAIAVPPMTLRFGDMSSRRNLFVDEWRRRIAASGPVVVWGAGAKGVTYCTLVDPDATRIAALVDVNPGKQRKHLPISGHRVVAPDELFALRPAAVVIMNPNYRAEIETMLSDLQMSADIMVLGDNIEAGTN